jgi:hypothetical protein
VRLGVRWVVSAPAAGTFASYPPAAAGGPRLSAEKRDRTLANGAFFAEPGPCSGREFGWGRHREMKHHLNRALARAINGCHGKPVSIA